MTSITRHRLFSFLKRVDRRFISSSAVLRVQARPLSNINNATTTSNSNSKYNNHDNNNGHPSANNINNNNDAHFVQEPQQPQNGALPDFAVGNGEGQYDWSRSYYGLSTQAFSREIADYLLAPLDPLEIEIKPGAYRCGFMRKERKKRRVQR
jgi:hypothetical protein